MNASRLGQAQVLLRMTESDVNSRLFVTLIHLN